MTRCWCSCDCFVQLVERAEADFDTLGIMFRGWIDFGVQLGEPRAAQMSKGAA